MSSDDAADLAKFRGEVAQTALGMREKTNCVDASVEDQRLAGRRDGGGVVATVAVQLGSKKYDADDDRSDDDSDDDDEFDDDDGYDENDGDNENEGEGDELRTPTLEAADAEASPTHVAHAPPPPPPAAAAAEAPARRAAGGGKPPPDPMTPIPLAEAMQNVYRQDYGVEISEKFDLDHTSCSEEERNETAACQRASSGQNNDNDDGDDSDSDNLKFFQRIASPTQRKRKRLRVSERSRATFSDTDSSDDDERSTGGNDKRPPSKPLASAVAAVSSSAQLGPKRSKFRRQNFCFLCQVDAKKYSFVPDDEITKLRLLYTENVGRKPPTAIALIMHRYYTDTMKAGAFNRQNYLPVWRTRDILIHNRKHVDNAIARQARNLTILDDCIAMAKNEVMQRNDRTGRKAISEKNVKVLAMLIKTQTWLSSQPIQRMFGYEGDANGNSEALSRIGSVVQPTFMANIEMRAARHGSLLAATAAGDAANPLSRKAQRQLKN